MSAAKKLFRLTYLHFFFVCKNGADAAKSGREEGGEGARSLWLSSVRATQECASQANVEGWTASNPSGC